MKLKKLIPIIGLCLLLITGVVLATITSETTRVSYSGNGSTTVFAYPFTIIADADLLVIIRDASGNETTQTLTTHYTVSGAGVDGGGNVTMVTAPASTETLTIMRDRALKQESDWATGGAFLAESLEADIDELTMIVQQLQEQLDRSIHTKKTSTLTDIEIDGVTAGEYLRWNLAGTGIDSIGQVSDLGTFLQSGTGAVSRTASSKMGEEISVTDFGAPTGVDDTSAFENAQTAAGAEGKVSVPAGTFLVKDLAITTLVEGVGKATIIKAYDDTTNGIVTFGAPSGQLRNVTIDGNTGDSKTAVGAYFSANGWDSKLDNVRFVNLGSYAVHINDSNHIEIKDCRFEGGTTYMIYGDKADNLLVDNSIFQSVTITNAIRLIYTGGADAGSNATIRNSWFEFDNASAKVTVPIYVAVQRVSIIDNKFNVSSDTQTAQIHLVDDSGSSNGTAEETYIGRNVFQNTHAGAKKLVVDSGVLATAAEWNRGLAAAADFTDNGTATLIRAMSKIADEELNLGSAAKFYRKLYATVSWNPGNLADGAGETKSVTVTGANFTDWVLVGAPYDLQDCTVSAYVQAADTVEIRLQNESGGARDLASATWTILVFDRV